MTRRARSFERGGTLNALTLRVENATGTRRGSRLSYLNAAVPEMGRRVKLVCTVAF